MVSLDINITTDRFFSKVLDFLEKSVYNKDRPQGQIYEEDFEMKIRKISRRKSTRIFRRGLGQRAINYKQFEGGKRL